MNAQLLTRNHSQLAHNVNQDKELKPLKHIQIKKHPTRETPTGHIAGTLLFMVL